MSAYIVSNKTISAIVKGFRVYNAAFAAEDYKQGALIATSIRLAKRMTISTVKFITHF